MTGIVTTASNAAAVNAQLAGGAIPTGYVRLTCGDPAIAVVALLGEDAPRITGGVGGWSVIDRPRMVGMTVWEGVEPYQLALSLMFDGWTQQASQETDIRKLQRVGRGDSESPPGVLIVEGIPLPARRWVIESIDYGDPILALDGSRYRQPLTLTLRQYVPPQFLRRRRSAYASSTKTLIVRAAKGDTPAKIAKR